MKKQIAFNFNGQTVTAAGIGHMAESDLIEIFQHVGAALTKGFKKRSVLSSWNDVLEYLRSQMGFRQTESFRVLFLDTRNQLIADEEMQNGTVNHVPVYPREVMKRALELNATAMILAHNHPSGDTTPSRADIEMTKALIDAGKIFGISIHDHVIIGKEGHTSLKQKGLI